MRQALDDIGIDEARANQIGVRLFKVGCPWPLDIEHIKDFARGLEMIIVVEEKRSLIEVQVRENLYGTAMQPLVVGKKDERGDWLFPAKGALDPNDIAIALGERMLQDRSGPSDEISRARRAGSGSTRRCSPTPRTSASRTPFFCSGCPHNTSTKVPEGSIAGAGIGCHFMALWMDRSTVGFTAMGGEGAQWIGQAPFSKREHFFQNLGDGTYNHSGMLAMRFALAAGVNITYKILFNDAVAMTGGQPHRGQPHRRHDRAPGARRRRRAHRGRHGRARQVSADRVAVPGRRRRSIIATISTRSSASCARSRASRCCIYDQTCAAEKRRRRKRGTYPDPDKRVIINELVCEGCGDCGVQSNCVSIQPVETEFGRKRTDRPVELQQGFFLPQRLLPVLRDRAWRQDPQGRRHRRRGRPARTACPSRSQFPLDTTAGRRSSTASAAPASSPIGAILGMAAHLEGKGCGMIDMAGLAQKGGAVFSHVRIARTPEDIHAIRVRPARPTSSSAATSSSRAPRRCSPPVRENHTIFVANTAEIMPGEFARSADFSLPVERLKKAIRAAAGEEKSHFFDATRTASALFGNSLGANMFMLGFAFQHGGLPLSRRGGREGDRAQRRGGGHERRRVPLGPARRASAGFRPRPRRPVGRAPQRAGRRRRSTRSSRAASSS